MRLSSAKLSWLDTFRLVRDPQVHVHWGQSGEDAVLIRLFRNRRDGFYVDIGAHHPRKMSNTYLLHRHFGWSGINVDASTAAIAAFKAERPRDVNLLALVGAGDETVTFTEYRGNAARNTADPERIEMFKGKALKVKARTVMTPRPLASILDEHAGGRRIDLLTVDIEGFDLQALQTNDWDRYRPEVICVEDFDAVTGGPTAISDYLGSVEFTRVSHCFDTSIYRKTPKA